MVRHIVIWDFQDQWTDEEKETHFQHMKEILEALPAVIPGVVSLKIARPLPSAGGDIVLNGVYESEEALRRYIVHPAHVEAGKYVRSVVTNRRGVDFVEE